MLKTGFHFLAAGLLAIGIVCVAKQFAAAQANSQPNPNAKPVGTQKQTFQTMPSVVAEVNGVKITKEELALECLKMHGREAVEEMIGLALVMQECKRLNITVTDEEAKEEIKRFASRFNVPVEQWIEVVKKEKGLSYEQYAAQMKQRVGLKKIAGQSVQVTNEEINRKLDSMYGPGVLVRQIVLFDKAKAEVVLRELQANPTKENFISLAKQRSDDEISASAGGLIPPIRRYSMPDNIQLENLLMNLKEGEITGIVDMGGFYVIFRCENDKYPAMPVNRQELAEKTYYLIEEEKINKAMAQILSRIVQNSQIMNFFEQPQSQAVTQYPTIIASVNGEPIHQQTVAEICAIRFGDNVLQGMIIHRIIQQKCKEANIAVSQEEINAELARIAGNILPLTPDGRPNVARLVEMQCREMKIEPAVYYSNVLWPRLALKKMTQGSVQVTQEDMIKAWEATYGPKVEVLAIFLNEERKAYDVWSQARKAYNTNQKPEEQIDRVKPIFGQLAAQHSIEQATRYNNGMIEPIARYSGMPQIENAAFDLQPGELSQIIPFDTVNGKQYLILFCLGKTQPDTGPFDDEIKQKLHDHIYDQKLEIEVAQVLNRLMSSATVDNYLAGKTQGPNMAGVSSNSTIR